MEVYVARQPIFNAEKELFGYELLFREGMSNYFPDIDGSTATSHVLYNSFFTIGIDKIIGDNTAFINFTEDLLVKKLPLMFPPEKVVVEVLETVEPKDEVVAACKEIADQGYHLALDDFFYDKDLESLIALANIIKFDFQATSFEKVSQYIEKLSKYDVILLAEKVENYDEFKIARAMGFKLFQGYFFSKPEILKGRDISSVQMSLLQVMAEVNKDNFEFSKVERIISRDVGISYKLLRYMNSAYYRRVCEISSIKQAIVLLGERGMRGFVSLIAMSKLAADKPDELVRSSVIRAKFCELMAQFKSDGLDPSELFTIGLFSLIDAILDDTMENLLGKLPLTDSIKKALLEKEGKLYQYLELSIAYQMAEWDKVSKIANTIRMDESKLPEYFAEAVAWADGLTSIR